MEQLKPNGRLVCPVGPPGGNQVLYQVDKDSTGRHVNKTALMGVIYVPLTDLQAQTHKSQARPPPPQPQPQPTGGWANHQPTYWNNK